MSIQRGKSLENMMQHTHLDVFDKGRSSIDQIPRPNQDKRVDKNSQLI